MVRMQVLNIVIKAVIIIERRLLELIIRYCDLVPENNQSYFSLIT